MSQNKEQSCIQMSQGAPQPSLCPAVQRAWVRVCACVCVCAQAHVWVCILAHWHARVCNHKHPEVQHMFVIVCTPQVCNRTTKMLATVDRLSAAENV
mmetsp:Transcript_48109/g.80918  ORF Transcript_48109/g.80918 Transcript_48109/m.80918 type:complete len:97 (+) Transcript_48109:680-970(+)